MVQALGVVLLAPRKLWRLSPTVLCGQDMVDLINQKHLQAARPLIIPRPNKAEPRCLHLQIRLFWVVLFHLPFSHAE